MWPLSTNGCPPLSWCDELTQRHVYIFGLYWTLSFASPGEADCGRVLWFPASAHVVDARAVGLRFRRHHRPVRPNQAWIQAEQAGVEQTRPRKGRRHDATMWISHRSPRVTFTFNCHFLLSLCTKFHLFLSCNRVGLPLFFCKVYSFNLFLLLLFFCMSTVVWFPVLPLSVMSDLTPS